MKRTTIALMVAALLALAVELVAQVPQVSTTAPAGVQHVAIATISGNTPSTSPPTFAITDGMTRHQVSFRASPAVTAATVTVYASTANNLTFYQVGTSTLLNDTITFNCACNAGQIVVTGFTGSGAIDADYYGQVPSNQSVSLTAAPFNTPIGAIADALKVSVVSNSSVQAVVDPCAAQAGSAVTVNITTSATVITGATAQNVYICHMHIDALAAATNVALVEGTGTVCATNIAGIDGGTTAANGWNLAINEGVSLGFGGFWVMKTATLADNVCLLLSAANQVSGYIRYVKAP